MYSPSVFVVGVPGAKNNAKMSAENFKQRLITEEQLLNQKNANDVKNQD